MVQNNSSSSPGGQASAQEGHGRVSASEIEKYIAGVDFPAQKQDLVQRAREQDAPQEVLEVMGQFPDREYGTAADVAKGISEAKH